MAFTREAPRGPVDDLTSTGDLSAGELIELVDALGALLPGRDDTEVVAQIEALERVKASAAAAQAVLAVALAHDRGLGPSGSGEIGRGRLGTSRRVASVGSEIGLARREGPHAGRRRLELADALLHDLPQTFSALACGDLSEQRASIIATETRDISPALRRDVDAALDRSFTTLCDHELRDLVRRVVFRLDAEGIDERWAKARERRHVTTRSLGDGTSRVSAIVADEHAAAIRRSLDKAADAICSDASRPEDDVRTRDQVKADIVVGRLTGVDPAQPVPVTIDLVVSAETLLGGGDEPGVLHGLGVVPAAFCRSLALRASQAARAELRRLFATPGAGELVALEARRRLFPPALAELIRLRDGGICRTPWCSAPIRHIDHVKPVREAGPTAVDNGQGLCVTCNQVKEEPGWVHWPTTDTGRQEVGVLTPAHHVHGGAPPRLPEVPSLGDSVIEIYLTDLILAA